MIVAICRDAMETLQRKSRKSRYSQGAVRHCPSVWCKYFRFMHSLGRFRQPASDFQLMMRGERERGTDIEREREIGREGEREGRRREGGRGGGEREG